MIQSVYAAPQRKTLFNRNLWEGEREERYAIIDTCPSKTSVWFIFKKVISQSLEIDGNIYDIVSTQLNNINNIGYIIF